MTNGLRRLTTGTALAGAAVLLLAGCAAQSTDAVGGAEASTTPSAAPDEDTASSAEPATGADWPRVDESGTGPTTLTIDRPSPDAFYLMASFTCTSGESHVELQEDPRVFMSGPCGGSSGYQMPLDIDATELNFTIDIDPGAEFTFTGTFQPLR
ncbi:hypothetical protein [Marisediminicola senii]|uniref:hypothetical protein n=1 Tax=Marisediminicola senii TaxID=2711233 RepID=UPI0013E9D509|nr:hypothetical protein [Marisediminicola senii]